jgi:hypothetical protein
MQKQTSPRTENPAIAGFLLGDYRTRTCRSLDCCELLSCSKSYRSRQAICTHTFDQNTSYAKFQRTSSWLKAVIQLHLLIRCSSDQKHNGEIQAVIMGHPQDTCPSGLEYSNDYAQPITRTPGTTSGGTVRYPLTALLPQSRCRSLIWQGFV